MCRALESPTKGRKRESKGERGEGKEKGREGWRKGGRRKEGRRKRGRNGEREGGEKVREGEEREKTDGQCVLLSTMGLLSQCLLSDHPQSSYLCETMFSTW